MSPHGSGQEDDDRYNQGHYKSFNAYVNGVHDGRRLYEIGKRTTSNLVGMQIGRNALIRYAEEVQSHRGKPDY
ncbi:hypothetical protein Tco_1283463 [Tanacetum coccineum]